MSFDQTRYCIDANVLIQAWQKYYSPKLCPSYWEVLNKLGEQGRLFIPSEVSKEIKKGEADPAEAVRHIGNIRVSV